MIAFHDRCDELARLERFWASDRPEFVVLTGRLRVRKNRLLEVITRYNPHVHVLGTAQTLHKDVRRFREWRIKRLCLDAYGRFDRIAELMGKREASAGAIS
jgi:AAA+ ATPase superfamily predicted ATPase